MDDCSLYHGWLVGVPINNPASVTAWATSAIGGGIWGVGGIASDGTNLFVATGNTYNTGGIWGGGEAVIRFQPGPIFSGSPSDYWAPLDWFTTSRPVYTRILGARARYLWTYRAQRPPSLSSQWTKVAMRICLIAVTSAGSPRPIDSFAGLRQRHPPGSGHLPYCPRHVCCFSR